MFSPRLQRITAADIARCSPRKTLECVDLEATPRGYYKSDIIPVDPVAWIFFPNGLAEVCLTRERSAVPFTLHLLPNSQSLRYANANGTSHLKRKSQQQNE